LWILNEKFIKILSKSPAITYTNYPRALKYIRWKNVLVINFRFDWKIGPKGHLNSSVYFRFNINKSAYRYRTFDDILSSSLKEIPLALRKPSDYVKVGSHNANPLYLALCFIHRQHYRWKTNIAWPDDRGMALVLSFPFIFSPCFCHNIINGDKWTSRNNQRCMCDDKEEKWVSYTFFFCDEKLQPRVDFVHEAFWFSKNRNNCR